jgi:predicted membrane protein
MYLLRFFWWLPVSLFLILFVISGLSYSGRLTEAWLAFYVIFLILIPIFLINLTGVAINLITEEKLARRKAKSKKQQKNSEDEEAEEVADVTEEAAEGEENHVNLKKPKRKKKK